VIWIWTSDPRSLGSLCIPGTNESMTRIDSSVPLIHHDPSDLGSLILILITPKECTLIILLSLEYYREELGCCAALKPPDYTMTL